MSDLKTDVLNEIKANPGRRSLDVIAVFAAIDHIPRELVAAEIVNHLNRGAIVMDGEQRLWPGAP